MNDRTTSHAKTIETPQDRADDLLQKYGYVKNTFDHARDPYISRQLNDEAAARRMNEQRGENSWMVSQEQPRFLNRPPDEIARPKDREAHHDRMAEDDKRARAETLLDRYGYQDRAQQSRDDTHDHSHKNGHSHD